MIFTVGISLLIATVAFAWASLVRPNWRWLIPAIPALFAGIIFFIIGVRT